MTWLELLGRVLLGLGALTLLASAVGLWTLPDALARQHAGTKAVTLAVALLALGAAACARDAAWTVRLLALLLFLFPTLPVASHMLARAAVHETGQDEETGAAPRIGNRRSP